jgi:hypothetical protein
MSTFAFRLKAPRPNFALDMSDEEREIMGRHAAYWQPLIDSGQMVVFGPCSTTRDRGVSVSSKLRTRTNYAHSPRAIR